MVICICSNINSQKLEHSLQGGCKTPAEVHEMCNSTPQCFKCFKEIRQAIEQQSKHSVTEKISK